MTKMKTAKLLSDKSEQLLADTIDPGPAMPNNDGLKTSDEQN